MDYINFTCIQQKFLVKYYSLLYEPLTFAKLPNFSSKTPNNTSTCKKGRLT